MIYGVVIVYNFTTDQWSEAVKKDPSKDPNKRRRAHVPASNSGN